MLPLKPNHLWLFLNNLRLHLSVYSRIRLELALLQDLDLVSLLGRWKVGRYTQTDVTLLLETRLAVWLHYCMCAGCTTTPFFFFGALGNSSAEKVGDSVNTIQASGYRIIVPDVRESRKQRLSEPNVS